MDYKTYDPEYDAELEKYFQTLSPAIRETITSDAIDTFVHEHVSVWNLDEEGEEAVVYEIALVLMKMATAEAFSSNLLTEALVSPEIATAITTEATKRFFQPLLSEVKVVATPSTPPTAPKSAVLGEKPYVEPPVRMAAYNAILDSAPTLTRVTQPPPPPVVPVPTTSTAVPPPPKSPIPPPVPPHTI